MNDILNNIRENVPFMMFGDGTVYAKMTELIMSLPDDEPAKKILGEALDDTFFSSFDEFDTKLSEFSKLLKDIQEGTLDESEKREKTRKKITDSELVNDFVVESNEGLNEFEVKLLAFENDNDISFINDIFRVVHTIKGSSGFLEFDELNHYAHIGENLLDELRNNRITIDDRVIEFLFTVLDALKKSLQEVSESLKDGFFPEFSLDTEWIEKEVEEIREGSAKVVIDKKDLDLIKEESKKTLEEDSEKIDGSGKITKFLKVDTDKVDFLLDNVGELIVVNNMLFQDESILQITEKTTQKILGELKRISTRLQTSSMALRMVPIGATFQKMMRVVRDNSKRLKKAIKLKISGEGTEIDRNMVDKLHDPLMHMIRNSCDHGIEMPKEREEAGKPSTGNIWLSSYHKGGNIVIEIRDDGKGLSKEKILKKALDNDLITPEQHLTDKEIFNLIFKPGFSTAEKVSEISGRGVGMDVVKNAITSLGGRVDIESTDGQGSVFYIKLPLTLAILDGVVIRIGDERFIIPAQVVEEAIKPTAEDYFNMANQGEMIKVRDLVHPLVRLPEVFQVESDSKNPEDGIVIIVETDRKKIGLMADEILGKQEVVIKNLGAFFKKYDFISSGAIMGDGTVSLIIDINKLL